MEQLTLEKIKKVVKEKGYVWFEDNKNKGYDVNIVGVRNSETKNKVTNSFDDKLTISYKVHGEWKFHCFDCTTDPGTHWVKNIMRTSGVAILKPGQYRSSHKIRLHAGRYDALCQKKPLKVYRDNNRDDKYDLLEENVQEGIFGINIHRATSRTGGKSSRVDRWSAGCQVIAANDDWQEFLEICKKAREIWGNSFTYTLIESEDLNR
jgi:hypothetical protein